MYYSRHALPQGYYGSRGIDDEAMVVGVFTETLHGVCVFR